jgi:spore coat protein CotH
VYEVISNKYINVIIAIIMTLSIVFAGVLATVDMSKVEASAVGEITQPEYITNLFNKDEIMEINIDIDENLWNELTENAINEEYYTANITVNGETYYDVGLRAKGNTTLSQIASDDTTDRYSFKVKFDKYIDGQTLGGLEKLALNNMMSDTTYMKEYLSYDLLNKMGISTPAFQYANITLNGEPWGLYLALEVMEESYIERYYGTTDGNLYKPETTNMAGGAGGANAGMEMDKDAITKATTNTENQDKNNNEDKPKENMEENNNIDMPKENMSGNKNNENMNSNKEENLASPPTRLDMSGAPEQENVVNNNDTTMSPGQGTEGNNMTMEQGKQMKGGMDRNNGGADLVYTGDDQSNYSTLFENAIFDHTDEEDYDKIIAMIKNLNENIENIEQYLDVDEVLRYFAVNTFIVNMDSYASSMKHNYYLYEQDGVCSILPWDYNLAFGAFQVGSASSAINFPIDNPVGDSLESSPLIGKLLEVEDYKEKYHEFLNEIVEDYVNSGVFTETINNLDKLIGGYVKNDTTAFYTYDEYVASIPELITFGVDRAKSIAAQLDGTQSSTSTGNIDTNLNLSALGSQGGGGNREESKGEISENNQANNIPQDMVNGGDGNTMTDNPQGFQGNNNGDKGGNMQQNFNVESMQQAMEIIQNSTGDSLTEDEIKQLEELGIDTTMIDKLQSGPGQGNFMPGNNQGGIKGSVSANTNIKSNLITYGIYLVVIIVALIVVLKFKRKKYHV